MLTTLWKKINTGILAVVMSFAIAIIAVSVNSEAAAKPKLSYTKTATVGKSTSIKIKNVKKGYYYKVTKTRGSVTTTPKVKKAQKINGKTATIKAVSKKTGTYKVTIQVYTNKKATKKVGKAITATVKANAPATKVRKLGSLTLAGCSLYVGEKAKIKATLTNATSAKLTFKSENPDIATVDSNGNVAGIKAGKAVIVAAFGSLTAKAYVTVYDVNLRLYSEKAEIYVGQQVNLRATVTPASAKVMFSSENPDIASVDAKGKVTGIKAGKATIVAACRNKTVKAYVTVSDANLELRSQEEVEVCVGGEYDLKNVIAVTPSFADVTFSSENPDTATVDAKGKVTGVEEGRATIVVTSGSKTVRVEVIVLYPNLELKLEKVMVCVGGKYDLKEAFIVDPDSAKVIYKSENPEIATVDSEGNVTGIKAGRTDIIVDAGNGAPITITVVVEEAANQL